MCRMATGNPALAAGAEALAAGAEDDEDEPPGVEALAAGAEAAAREVEALDRRNASTTEDRFMSVQTSAKPSRILEIVGLEHPETPMPTKSCSRFCSRLVLGRTRSLPRPRRGFSGKLSQTTSQREAKAVATSSYSAAEG